MSSESRPRTAYLGDHRMLTRTAHGHAIFVDTRDLRDGPQLLLDGAGFGELTLLSGELVGEGGRPEALPVPVEPITVLAFADELLLFPDLLTAFTSTYSGKPATLVVLGIDWEQHALDGRLDALGAPARLSRQGLDLVAVAAPAGGPAEQDIAELVDVVFTHRPVPGAFRFLMVVDPATTGEQRLSVLSPDPVGPLLPLYEELPGRQRSRLCNEEQLLTEDYAFWCGEFGQQPARHRKQWEYVFICKVLHERGLLAPGRRGIGFGVGSEPLPALFARYGSEVVASDLGLDAAVAAGWQNGNQHAQGIDQLNKLGLCPPDEFRRRVSFRVEDMNAISPDLHGGFDFTWSSCCFEHLGSIEHGLRFVEESLKLLKPGGIAVHTTEFNLSSNDDTVFEGGCVIFRRRDIDRLAQRVTAQGHRICLDYTEGTLPGDLHVDVPPYTQSPHLRLLLQGFVSTSIGLVVQKAPA